MGESVKSVGTARLRCVLEILRDTRELKGISQRELSKRLGQQFTYIVKIERGTRRVDVVELVLICQVLGVDPAEIVAKLRDVMKGRG